MSRRREPRREAGLFFRLTRPDPRARPPAPLPLRIPRQALGRQISPRPLGERAVGCQAGGTAGVGAAVRAGRGGTLRAAE